MMRSVTADMPRILIDLIHDMSGIVPHAMTPRANLPTFRHLGREAVLQIR